MESIIQTLTTWWSYIQPSDSDITAFVIGMLIGLLILAVLFLLTAPVVLQKALTDDPNDPNKLALFANPKPGETNVKMRNGREIGYIRGGEPPQYGSLLNPWTWYQWYCYQFGLYLIGIPGLQTLYNYELPRIITHSEIVGGKKRDVFEPKIDRSNQVRTKAFTFYIVASGAEIETVPTTVEGSLQVRITPLQERKALFETDHWNVLLTQAVNSVIPGVLKSELTLSDIIGSIPKELWKNAEKGMDVNVDVSAKVFKALENYRVEIDGKKFSLKEVASIEILSVDITNFIPELSDDEMRELRSPVTGRQKGRGRDLEGQGVAAAQQSSIDVIKTAGSTGLAVLEADAFVRASEAGKIDAFAAGIIKKFMPASPKEKE